MIYDNLPQLIKDKGQCCVWNLEKRKSRNTKVPYNPITGNHAYVDNPETFVDFETVVKAVSNYSGIGIRVNGRIIGIDVNVNIRMYNFDDVQCTVIPSVAYGFVTGMNLQLC